MKRETFTVHISNRTGEVVRKATDPPLRWLPGHQAMGETARQLNLRGPQSVVMTRTCRAAELPLGKVLSDPQRRIPLDVTATAETIDLGPSPGRGSGLGLLAPVPGRSLYEALGMHKTLALFQ